MANTPYPKLGSEDILSAHLNGVQYSIGTIEDVLGLGTDAKTGQPLEPVVDMEDTALRYRIYEGNDRGWLDTPTPVIYRNGNIVARDEYQLQPAYGVVVFISKQGPDDTITADFTHVVGDSTVINSLIEKTNKVESIESNVSTLSSDLTGVQQDVTALTGRVDTIETDGGSGSGGSGDSSPQYGTVDLPLDPNARWIANYKKGVDLNTVTYYENALMGGSTIDLFPVYIPHAVVVDKLRTRVGASNWRQADMQMGLYTSKGVKPHKLIAKTERFTALNPGNWDRDLITDGDGNPIADSKVALEAGLYWVGRYHSSGINLRGTSIEDQSYITIAEPTDTSIIDGSGTDPIGGVRVKGATGIQDEIGELSSSSVNYLRRINYGITFLRIANSY